MRLLRLKNTIKYPTTEHLFNSSFVCAPHTDPLYLIPLFFSSGSPTRLAICLFVHPALLEAGEALGRGTKGDTVSQDMRSGKIKTFEDAAARVVEHSAQDIGFKLQMAFYRRFMLLNMGSADATMFAIVAASIEEVSRNVILEI